MELATRVVSIERGRDRAPSRWWPRRCGPVHGSLAQALGVPRVILPAAAG